MSMTIPAKTLGAFAALAAAATLAVGLLAPGAAVRAQPAASDLGSNPFANDPTAPAAGRALFDGTCAACHGTGAVGSERAPALTSGNFQHGGADTDLFQTIRAGVPGTAMPAFTAMPADNVWKLVTYIKSLSGENGPRGTATGNAVAGRDLFFGAGGCTGCHEVDGRGADFASDLSAEGTKPVAAIHAGVLHQPMGGRGRRGPAAPQPVNIVTKTGQTIHGLLRGEDTFYIELEDASGKWTSYERAKLKSITPSGSAAPTDIATRLTPTQINDIVAFLAGHKARDLAQTAKATPRPVLTYDRLVKPEPQNWPTYWGSYDAHHFSNLTQINTANVKNLRLEWSGTIASPNGNSEATPLVVDGVMYFSTPGEVVAYDAVTGIEKWAFHRKQDIKNPSQNNANNKGVAVLDGRLFVGTLDCLLIAIDIHTGRELWETRTDDTMAGFQLGGAPLVLDGKVIMGMSGGEFGTRGYLDAYDPATGKRLWRTYTIPGPGEKGNDTWAGDSWKYGGAPTWLTGSYDPKLHTLYWAVGNPGPDYNAENRKGDNLYTDSILALDPDTGAIKWHYQFTPNDDHDWDSTEAMVLADMKIGGRMRQVVLHADRNGVYYILDRTNGQFILATPFVRTNWFKGFDKNGRPEVNPDTIATRTGNVVFPATGGTNFQAPSYDARTETFYLEYVDRQGFAISAPVTYERGRLFLGRGTGAPPPGPEPEQGVKALDARTGKTLWEFPLARVSLSAGVMGTAGGVLFVGAAEGQLIALDSKTGKALWHTKLPGMVSASPISYAVNGKQYVAIIAANTVYSFALPDK